MRSHKSQVCFETQMSTHRNRVHSSGSSRFPIRHHEVGLSVIGFRGLGLFWFRVVKGFRGLGLFWFRVVKCKFRTRTLSLQQLTGCSIGPVNSAPTRASRRIARKHQKSTKQ